MSGLIEIGGMLVGVGGASDPGFLGGGGGIEIDLLAAGPDFEPVVWDEPAHDDALAVRPDAGGGNGDEVNDDADGDGEAYRLGDDDGDLIGRGEEAVSEDGVDGEEEDDFDAGAGGVDEGEFEPGV